MECQGESGSRRDTFTSSDVDRESAGHLGERQSDGIASAAALAGIRSSLAKARDAHDRAAIIGATRAASPDA
jgi:hypothetical protein